MFPTGSSVPTTSPPTSSPIKITQRPTYPPRKGVLLEKGTPGFAYIADPNALVVNDTLYLFCSTDPPTAKKGSRYSLMREYTLLTTKTLEEDAPWLNHGTVLRPSMRFPHISAYTGKLMFAPAAAYAGGWFYLYFPFLRDSEGSSNVGIARARNPTDPQSWELVVSIIPKLNLFDPAIMVAPDGRVYMYGNSREPGQGPLAKRMLGGELSQDMTSFVNSHPKSMSIVYGGFITEGVFAFWRPLAGMNGGEPRIIYYLIARIQPNGRDCLYYWMSESPLKQVPASNSGYQLTPNQYDAAPHCSVAEFKGRYYLFYHSGLENGGNRFRRSSCMDELTFQSDGHINFVRLSCAYQPTKK